MLPPFSCARRRAPRAPTGDLLYPLHQGCQVGRFPLRGGEGRDGCACGRPCRQRAGNTGVRWLSARRGASEQGAAYSPECGRARRTSAGSRDRGIPARCGQTPPYGDAWRVCARRGAVGWSRRSRGGTLRSDVYRGEGLAATFVHGAAPRYGGLGGRAIAPLTATTPIIYNLWTQEADASPASERADRWAAWIIGSPLAQAGFVPRPLCAPRVEHVVACASAKSPHRHVARRSRPSGNTPALPR